MYLFLSFGFRVNVPTASLFGTQSSCWKWAAKSANDSQPRAPPSGEEGSKAEDKFGSPQDVTITGTFKGFM